MRQEDFTLDFLAVERHTFPLVNALGKTREENLGIEFVESGLRAFEKQLGETLAPEPGTHPDIQQVAFAGGLDFYAFPGFAVGLAVNAEIAIGIVQLEVQVGLVELQLLIGQGQRRSGNQCATGRDYR